MTKTLFRAAAMLLVVSAAGGCNDSPTAPSASGNAADNEAVVQIVAAFDARWTAGDFTAYAAQFASTEGWEWVGPTGVVLADPVAITGLYKTLFSVVFPGTSRTSVIRNLTFLSNTLAVLDLDARVTGFTSLPPTIVPWQPGTVRVLEKNILVKRDEEWRIVRHQQTSVAPGVP